jgi:Flp pilus assembly protein TadG
MSRLGQLWQYFKLRGCAGTEASQIVELVIAMPLLMVIVVGITDFGTAFNLKQKLNNAAWEGARTASKQSMTDVSNATPLTTDAIRDVIDNYLLAEHVNDCGLSTAPGSKSGLIWTYTATSGCPGLGLTLTIDRGKTFQTTGAGSVAMETTHISIEYPYLWRFGSFVRFFVPSANYASGVTQIRADAIMTNLN